MQVIQPPDSNDTNGVRLLLVRTSCLDVPGCSQRWAVLFCECSFVYFRCFGSRADANAGTCSLHASCVALTAMCVLTCWLSCLKNLALALTAFLRPAWRLLPPDSLQHTQEVECAARGGVPVLRFCNRRCVDVCRTTLRCGVCDTATARAAGELPTRPPAAAPPWPLLWPRTCVALCDGNAGALCWWM